jgi:hypothetical protein
LRAEGRRLFPPRQTIRAIKLYHRQVYKFEYHRPKLAMLREGREHARLAGVVDFLERIPAECPASYALKCDKIALRLARNCYNPDARKGFALKIDHAFR